MKNKIVALFFNYNISLNELDKLIRTINSNKELYSFFMSSNYSSEQKEQYIKSTLSKYFSLDLIKYFVNILENNMIDKLTSILNEVSEEITKRDLSIHITIFSVEKIDDNQINKIKQIYEKKYRAKQSTIEVKLDKTLIGGLKVIVNGDVYDNTIKNKLSKIKEKIQYSNYEIEQAISEELEDFKDELENYEYGEVVKVDEEIVNISGLAKCKYGEILVFEDGSKALALNLNKDSIGAVLLEKNKTIKIGMKVSRSGRPASIKASEALLGKVIDVFGNTIDGTENIKEGILKPIFTKAPGIMSRKAINRPLVTGITAVDTMVPIGKGQRELIIGDKQTGKTTLALDSIINQKDKDVVCIYVSIGQKTSSVENIIKILKEKDALKHTIIIVSSASDLAAKQYIAPYAGCAVAEYFMHNLKKDVLIVYDDLTKHAISYRTISLLLRRPPGREAYPGDIFYIHSRLLERASQLSDELGGGSMTALPIVETEEGDISSYIPTNIISITDGQIHLDTSLFHSGQRPAINAGLSVSRVGSEAQSKMMKLVSSSIRLSLSQYYDLEIFSEFGADLEEGTKKKLENGKKILEALKQNRHELYDEAKEVVITYLVLNNLLEDVDLSNINQFINNFIIFIKDKEIYNNIINYSKDTYSEFKAQIESLLIEFKKKANNG
ncbi:MAG: F0F1 ATP synthase subunit alpha [Bacilli bacterium]|nr:F0F1 ATP synthase subunit alpha [Bacilli bacterium]